MTYMTNIFSAKHAVCEIYARHNPFPYGWCFCANYVYMISGPGIDLARKYKYEWTSMEILIEICASIPRKVQIEKDKQ